MQEKGVQISQKGLYEGTQTYRKGLYVSVFASFCQYGEREKETLPGDVRK
jgi:hypothetical protein